MASLLMPLAVYERGGVPTDPLWDVETRGEEPGPGSYDPYPFLTPATHRTTKAQYYPDRALQYPGGNLYAQQPMWLSLPIKERNRFWVSHRAEFDKTKKNIMEKNFLSFPDDSDVPGASAANSRDKNGANALQRTVVLMRNNPISEKVLSGGNDKLTKSMPAFFRLLKDNPEKQLKFTMGKSLTEIVYNNRDLPMNTYARIQPNLGNHPYLKRVASEPMYPQYDTNTSTLSFADRRQLQRQFRQIKGANKIHKKILETKGNWKALTNMAKDGPANNKAPTEFPSWFIPPLPKEEGLGETMAHKAIDLYKVQARARDIEPNAPNQRDCIGTRWTGIGNASASFIPN